MAHTTFHSPYRGEQYFSVYSLWSMVCLHPVEVLFRPRLVTSAMSSLAASENAVALLQLVPFS